MTKPYYWKIFLKTKVTDEDRKLLEFERPTSTEEKISNENDYYKIILSENSFEVKDKDKMKYYSDTLFHSGKLSFILDSTNNFSPTFSENYFNITCKEYAWFRANVYVFPVYDIKDNPVSLVMNFDHKGRNMKYRALDMEKLDLKLNQWNLVTFDYLSPEVRSDDEKISTYIWLRGKKKVFIDDFNVIGLLPKTGN